MFSNRILRTLSRMVTTLYPQLKLSSGKTSLKTLTAFVFNLTQSESRKSLSSLNRTKALTQLLSVSFRKKFKLPRKKLMKTTNICRPCKTYSIIFPTLQKSSQKLQNSLFPLCIQFYLFGTILKITTLLLV